MFRTVETRKARAALAGTSGAAPGVVGALFRCADPTRVQWVSPAAADADEFCDALERVNAGGRFLRARTACAT